MPARSHDGRRFRILYLGDFDASGVHMARDLEEKLRAFLWDEQLLCFQRIAVMPRQIREWGLPSRPNKETDTRHAAFVAEFPGFFATELDSIRPDVLRQLVEDEITASVDGHALDRILTEEKEARALARKITASIGGAR